MLVSHTSQCIIHDCNVLQMLIHNFGIPGTMLKLLTPIHPSVYQKIWHLLWYCRAEIPFQIQDSFLDYGLDLCINSESWTILHWNEGDMENNDMENNEIIKAWSYKYDILLKREKIDRVEISAKLVHNTMLCCMALFICLFDFYLSVWSVNEYKKVMHASLNNSLLYFMVSASACTKLTREVITCEGVFFVILTGYSKHLRSRT